MLNNNDFTNNINKQGVGLILLESDNALNWEIADEPFLLGQSLLWEDGRLEEYSRLEMPKLIYDGDQIVAISLAARPKDPTQLSYNIQIPIIK